MGEETRKLRKPKEEVREVLNRLDEQSKATSHINVRNNDRYDYRVSSLDLELLQPNGLWQPHLVPTRNLSRNGASLLVGHFIYNGTPARLRLVSVHNHVVVVTGKVARCRYVSGSGTVYELGIQFDSPIDIALFHHGATDTNVLMVDDDPSLHELARRLLKTMNVKIVSALDADKAIELVKGERFDLVLMDLELPGTSGIDAVRAIRELGFTKPIIALTGNTSPETRTHCLEAGFTAWATKPFTRESLATIIASTRPEPIVSSMVHDREMVELIDEFVAKLPERVRELEMAFDDADPLALAKQARRMRGEAGCYGFEVITQAAADLEAACTASAEKSARRPKLDQLLRLCLAARPASGIEQAKKAASGAPSA